MTRSDRIARLPLYRLLVAAILIVAMSLAPSLTAPVASAARSPSPASSPFPSVEEEWEEEEWEEGEWEEEEEWEEGEEEGAEGESGSGWEGTGEDGHRGAPEACALYSMSARIVSSERRHTVSLRVRYTSDEATGVKVEYWLKGSRGALQMKPLRRRMSRHGSLHGVERLSAREMAKLRAARSFVVDRDMTSTPSSCARYCTRHLTDRQQHGGRTVWNEPTRAARGR